MTMTIYPNEGEPLEFSPPRRILWCVRHIPPYEFVGPKCLLQLVTHYEETHCPATPERYYTLHEVSEITGITQWTLAQRRQAGTLPAQREDRTGWWMVAESDIEKIRPVRAKKKEGR